MMMFYASFLFAQFAQIAFAKLMYVTPAQTCTLNPSLNGYQCEISNSYLCSNNTKLSLDFVSNTCNNNLNQKWYCTTEKCNQQNTKTLILTKTVFLTKTVSIVVPPADTDTCDEVPFTTTTSTTTSTTTETTRDRDIVLSLPSEYPTPSQTFVTKTDATTPTSDREVTVSVSSSSMYKYLPPLPVSSGDKGVTVTTTPVYSYYVAPVVPTTTTGDKNIVVSTTPVNNYSYVVPVPQTTTTTRDRDIVLSIPEISTSTVDAVTSTSDVVVTETCTGDVSSVGPPVSKTTDTAITKDVSVSTTIFYSTTSHTHTTGSCTRSSAGNILLRKRKNSFKKKEKLN